MLTPSVYTDAWESFVLTWFLPACSHFARCNSFVVCSMDQAEYSFQFIQNYFNKYILYMYSITKNEWISHIKSWNQLSCKKILNLEITLTSAEEERHVERLKRRINSVSWRLSWLQGETEPVPTNSEWTVETVQIWKNCVRLEGEVDIRGAKIKKKSYSVSRWGRKS